MPLTAVPGLATKVADLFNAGGPPLMLDMNPHISAAESGMVRFTLAVTERLTHSGGVLCGQAILGCMDSGIVLALMSTAPDEIPAFTTVELKTSFERAVPADIGEVEFVARLTKPGRTLVFAEVEVFLPDGRRAAHATSTYMRL